MEKKDPKSGIFVNSHRRGSPKTLNHDKLFIYLCQLSSASKNFILFKNSGENLLRRNSPSLGDR